MPKEKYPFPSMTLEGEESALSNATLHISDDEVLSQPAVAHAQTRTHPGNYDEDDDEVDSEETLQSPEDEEFDDGTIYSDTSLLLPLLKKPSTLVVVFLLFTFSLSQCLVLAPSYDVMIQLICMDLQKQYASLGSLPGKEFMESCRGSTDVAEKVAQFQSYRAIISGIMGLIVTPRLATLSDRWGRKPIYLICIISGLLGDVMTLLCISHPQTVNYRFLLLSSFIQGFGGSLVTVQVINSAYISDSVEASVRVRHLGWLDSCLFAAVATGPFLGSIIQSYTNSIVSLYFVSVTLYAVDFLILVILLSESRTLRARRDSQAIFDHNSRKKGRMQFNIERRSSSLLPLDSSYLRHFKETIEPLKQFNFPHLKSRVDRRNGKLLVVLSALSSELVMAVSSLLVLYSQFQFHWTSVEAGYLLSVFGVARTTVLAVLAPFFVSIVRSKCTTLAHNLDRGDTVLIRTGLVLSSLGFLAISQARTGSQFVSAMVFDSLAGVQLPSVKNALIKHGHKDRIGELLGALSILNCFGLVVVPVVFLQLYKWSVDRRPQLAFEICSIGFLCLLLMSFLLTVFTQEHSLEDLADEEDPLLAAPRPSQASRQTL